MAANGKEPVIKKDKASNAKKERESISLEHLLPQAGGSIFRLARMAMIRASEIHFGSAALVEREPLDKETTIALREISKGEVSLADPEMCPAEGAGEGGEG